MCVVVRKVCVCHHLCTNSNMHFWLETFFVVTSPASILDECSQNCLHYPISGARELVCRRNWNTTYYQSTVYSLYKTTAS